MEKQIQLNDLAARSMTDLAKKRVEEIDREIVRLSELKEERKSLIAAIDALSFDKKSILIDPDYNNSWTWIQKAVYFIKCADNQFITTKSIVDQLIEREPLIDRKRAVSAISSVLSTSKEIEATKNERGEKIYGLRSTSQENVSDDEVDPFSTGEDPPF